MAGHRLSGGHRLGAITGDDIAVGSDGYPFQTTFAYSGQPDPAHTDVIGLAALDYSGGAAPGPSASTA